MPLRLALVATRRRAVVGVQTGLLDTNQVGDKREDGQRRGQRRAKRGNEDGPVLTFEHPTLAGQQVGGWMTPDARRLAGAHLSEESAYAQAKRDMHAARAAAIEAADGP